MKTDGWELRVHAVLAERYSLPFAWRSNDCVSCAAAVVQAATGVDYLAELPTWTDEASAAAAIASVGGMRAWLDERFTRINPLEAQLGDLGLVGTAVNVCVRIGWASPSSTGLAITPLSSASEAWRV